MDSNGSILAFGALFFAMLLFAISPLIRKATSKYYFWFIIGSIFFIYEMCGRFYNDFNNLIHYDKNVDDTIIISKGLLLDLCPFCALMLPLCLIIDPTRRLAAVLSPFAIFGGLITLFGEIATNADGDVTLSPTYIFLGIGQNPMYYMIHFINLVLGFFVLANFPRVYLKGFIYMCYFIILYFAYVLIVVAATGTEENVTGVTGNDWWGREYGSIGEMLTNLGLSPWGVVYFGYFLATLAIIAIFFIFSFLMKIKYFQYKKTIKTNDLIYNTYYI